MKTVSMSGTLRAHVGKKDAKKLRYQGDVPCVLYGGKDQVHFSMTEKDFKKIIFTPNVYIIKISIEGKEYTAILQDIQYHPVSDSILHADFLEVSPGKPIVIGIPVKINGKAPGILKGGKLHKKIRKLVVKGLVDDLPDNIEVDINKLDIGDSIKVKDIKYANLEFLDTPNSEVIGVKTARGAAAGEQVEEEGGEETAAEVSEEQSEATE
jgi:large subunit ribosomal protein L25